MFRNSQKSIASQRVRVFMRVLFGVFLFFYFYCLQSPILSLAQLHLSEGKTVYYPFVSAIVLTCVLLLVQKFVVKWIDFTDSLYFFSYVPSVVLAVLTTAFTPSLNVSVLIFCTVALVAFCIASFICFKLSPHDSRDDSFTKLLATHLLGMIGVFFSLGAFSNSNDVQTYEIQIADLINHSKYDEALHIGEKSLVSSPRLSALRAYALAHTKEGIGDRLFTYPLVTTGAEQLLFSPADTLAQLLSPDSLYVKLGIWRSNKETALQFLHRALARHDNDFIRDYWLSGLLLDKQIDKFVSELSRYYLVNDSTILPKHYEEALVMYYSNGGKNSPFAQDSSMLKSFYDYKMLGDQFQDSLIRRNQLFREYGDTYWWYFDFQNQ